MEFWDTRLAAEEFWGAPFVNRIQGFSMVLSLVRHDLVACRQGHDIAEALCHTGSHQLLRRSKDFGRLQADGFGNFNCVNLQRSIRDDAPDQPPIMGRRSINYLPGEVKFGGALPADYPGQEPGAAVTGDKTDLQKSCTKFCGRTRDAHISKAGDIIAKPDRWTIDRRDDRHLKTPETSDYLMDPGFVEPQEITWPHVSVIRPLAQLLEVASSRKGATRTSQDHTPQISIGIQCRYMATHNVTIVPEAKSVPLLGAVNGDNCNVFMALDKKKARHSVLHFPVLRSVGFQQASCVRAPRRWR